MVGYNKINAYSIELYLGEVRSGKTLTMVAETYQDMIKNNCINDTKVFSNIQLNKKYFPTAQYITHEDLEKYHEKQELITDSIILIDEIHLFLDSRRFMDKKSQKIGYFIGQMGKRGNVFRGNTHFPRLIDVRLRQYCERFIYINKCMIDENNKIQRLKNNHKKLTPNEQKKLLIEAQPVIRKLDGYDFRYYNDKKFYVKASKYFDLYDTEELIASR